VEWCVKFCPQPLSSFLKTFLPQQALLPESPRYLLLKDRQAEARKALGRLMSLPANSPEVEAEAVEISTALAVELEVGTSTYLDCFKNTENRNGFRTWTGILLQGVRSTYVLYFLALTARQCSGNNLPALTSFVSIIYLVFLLPN
jgi:hypothetical protein